MAAALHGMVEQITRQGRAMILSACERRVVLRAAIAVAGTLLTWCGPLHAQGAPGVHQDNGGINGSLTRSDLEKLGGIHKDSSTDVPKDPVAARAKAKAQSLPVLDALQISCEVSDARLVVAGTRRPQGGGREVETRVYEVACSGSLGYLLQTTAKEPSVAISCLSAEEARAADVAKGKQPTLFCSLPDNTDVHALLSSMIKTEAEAECSVDRLQFFGRSESTHSDYSEVACKDGKGFLVRIAQPGSQARTLVMSCADAARQNIKCRLTDPGPVEAAVTLQVFKEALARNGVSCNIAQIRLIGQEDHLKRYVVEYLCTDQSVGTVAFIPLPGNSNPYESLDCATALSRRDVVCNLKPN
jgi:hypothetical protein